MPLKSLLPWLMLFLAGICLRSGIASVAPVLEDIRHSLQIETRWLGLLTAIPVICMGVLSPLGHQLEQKAGLRNSMLLAFGLLIAGLLLRLDSHSFALLLLTAGLVGVADAIIRPLLSGFIKDKFPRHSALAMSLYSASMGLGAAVAAWGTPLISSLSDAGWRMGLAVWALPALCALLVWYTGSSRDAHVAVTPAEAQLAIPPRQRVYFTLFFGLQAGINYSVVAWLPAFIIQQGHSAHLAGLVMAFCVVTQLLTSLLFSLLTRLFRISRAAAPLVFALITLAGAAAMLTDLSPWLAPLLLGIGTGGLFPIALLIPLDFTVTKSQAIRLSGITQSGGYLLGGVVPWLCGIMAEALGMRAGLQIALLLLTLMINLVALRIAAAYQQCKGQRDDLIPQ